MPYGMPNKKQDKKVEKCVSSPDWKGKVNNRTGNAYTKQEIIAICKSRVLNKSVVEVDGELWLVTKKKKKSASSCICDVALASEDIDDPDGVFDITEAMTSKKLTYETRRNLPDSAFCLVKKVKGKSGKMLKVRKFPAHDKTHVQNGLAQLPKADLSAEDRKTIRNCLVKRAKKYNIKVSAGGEEFPIDGHHVYSFSPTQDIEEFLKSSGELSLEESQLLSSAINVEPDDDGLYTVFAGMEGQSGFNFWGERFIYAAEFFESNFKLFEGSFYYPSHHNALNVEKRYAIVEKSFIVKLGEKEIVAMFHKIRPRDEIIAKQIENRFLSDVSIDVFSVGFSPDDDHLIVDGKPYGTAFVAGLPEMKGCPVCRTVHTVGSSCLTSVGCLDPNKEEQEVENLAKEGEEASPSGKEDEQTKAVGSESKASDGELKALTSEMQQLRAEMNEQKFGNAVQEIATSMKVEKEVVMAALTASTPEERLEKFNLIIKAADDRLKDAVKSKVIVDDKLAGEGTGDDDEEGEKKTQAAVTKALGELTGSSGGHPEQVDPPAGGGA